MSGKHKLESVPQNHATLVEPMECLSVSKPPEGSQCLWEIKLDGYRDIALLPCQNGKAKCTERVFKDDLWQRPNRAHRLNCGKRGCLFRRRSEEHTSELQSHSDLVCRLLLEK